jgi:hypothetical protein
MVGKTVGELSPFKDIESNKVMLERLQKDGYVRYENLPLETRDGRTSPWSLSATCIRPATKNIRDPMQHPRHHGTQTENCGR